MEFNSLTITFFFQNIIFPDMILLSQYVTATTTTTTIIIIIIIITSTTAIKIKFKKFFNNNLDKKCFMKKLLVTFSSF